MSPLTRKEQSLNPKPYEA
jgi:uncharacterized protein YciW